MAPAFVEFVDKCANMDAVSNNILYPVVCATMPIFSQPNATLPIVDGAVRALPAVSYTHLDVYKRQKQILSKTQILENVFDLEGDFVDENTIAVNILSLIHI